MRMLHLILFALSAMVIIALLLTVPAVLIGCTLAWILSIDLGLAMIAGAILASATAYVALRFFYALAQQHEMGYAEDQVMKDDELDGVDLDEPAVIIPAPWLSKRTGRRKRGKRPPGGKSRNEKEG